MSRTDLYIRYNVQGKREKRLKLTAKSNSFVMGKSAKAHLHLVGQDVSPLHSAIECRSGKWYLMDLASETGTWINEEFVAEEAIQKQVKVRIGQHTLILEPKQVVHRLYSKKEFGNEGKDYHEIIIKNKKGVLDIKLIEKNQSFHFYHNGKDHVLKAPKNSEICETEFGNILVLQRLVKAPPQLEEGETKFGVNSKSIKLGIMAMAAFALLIGLVMLFPHAPVEEELKKPEMNAYTRLIFDKNMIQSKRKQAMNLTQFKASESKQETPNPSSDTRKQMQTAPKIITNLKASGLQQLLGKIATRQNAFNKNIINAQGSTDYTKAQGVATSTGKVSVSGVSGGIQGGTDKKLQIAAINTKGVGGGANIENYGTIANGGIGSADVGVVEEEVEVGGGLDRDAVAAVIKANIGQIRYCYERKLTANPNLYGKVLVQFSIEGQGAVLRPKVSRTTLQDTDVEGCILRRLSQWKFPTPPAGTSVLVTYPFLFKSTQ